MSPPEYTTPEAKRHWFTKRFPPAGTVGAQMCPDCGLIRLYGKPHP
jgi:hypothetical protein